MLYTKSQLSGGQFYFLSFRLLISAIVHLSNLSVGFSEKSAYFCQTTRYKFIYKTKSINLCTDLILYINIKQNFKAQGITFRMTIQWETQILLSYISVFIAQDINDIQMLYRP
jgi:hypothetical protein